MKALLDNLSLILGVLLDLSKYAQPDSSMSLQDAQRLLEQHARVERQLRNWRDDVLKKHGHADLLNGSVSLSHEEREFLQQLAVASYLVETGAANGGKTEKRV